MSATFEIIASKTKNCSFSLQSIEKFLALMAIQQPEYNEISYKANGPFSLVLRATKNGDKDVALKVLECTDQTESQIQAMEREYSIRKQLLSSDYFMAIQNQFFLTEMKENEEQSSNLTSFTARKVFFVQQMEMCQENLQDVLLHYSEQNQDPITENYKEQLAIQILDAVNLLHQRQIAHGNITTQHILVSSSKKYPVLLKLCNLRFNSPAAFRNQQDSISDNESLNHLPYLAAYQRDQLEQDLVSIGKVLLQLDSIGTSIDQSTISNTSLSQLDAIIMLKTHQLNQTTQLNKIAVSLLTNCKDNSQSISSILLLLLSKQTKALKIPLFSVVLKIQVECFCLPVHSQRIIIDCLVWQICKQRKINKLSNLFDENGQRKTILTADLLKSALSIMLEWTEFSGVFEVLGVGVGGVIFGVENLKEKRNLALKLSLCTNKAETIREIGIWRIFQTPCIVQFYGYKFFKDANGNEFVVYELERCKYSLTHYLELQRMYGEYSDEQKIILTLQMIDSISLLHENHIILRNIKLESFVITENKQGQVVVKLANFSHAIQLQNHFEELRDEANQSPQQSTVNCYQQRHNMESPLYFAPEQWDNFNCYTYQTDSFSSGICIFLLDNWLVCSEEQLARNLISLSLGSTKKCIDMTKMSSQINGIAGLTKITQQLLILQPQQRQSIKKLTEEFMGSYEGKNEYLKVKDVNTIQKQKMNLTIKDRKGLTYFQQSSIRFDSLYSVSLNLNKTRIGDNEKQSLLKIIGNLLNLQRISMAFSRSSNVSFGDKVLLSPLANLHNLSCLTLHLGNNEIGGQGAQSLLFPLANLLNLSSLTLHLELNKIGDQGAQSLLSPLKNLHNLSSLTLDLFNNEIGDQGAQSLLSPLENLHHLSSLTLHLQGNKIGVQGAQSLLSPLANLQNFSSITLFLGGNKIGDLGAQSLLFPLANLLNLSSLSLNLNWNKIEGLGAQSLLSPLANLQDLSSLALHLEGNKIGVQGAQCLLSPLMNLKNLSTLILHLNNNKIGDQGAQSLLSPLANLHNLQSLTLHLMQNEIGDQGAQSLLSSLENLHNLSSLTLYLNWNKIGGPGAQSLLSPLGNLLNLSSLILNLNWNQIGGLGAQSLLSPLTNLHDLSSLNLYLEGNIIGDQGGESLLSPLENLHNLSSLTLDLFNNEIGDQGAQSLLSPLANLKNLSNITLLLNNNQIRDQGAQSLLSSLANLLNLLSLTLHLEGNKIGVHGVQSLLSCLMNLHSLSSLILNLNWNIIEDLGAQSMLSPLEKLHNLLSLTLHLEGNKIGNQGAQSLLFPLSNLHNLSDLTLHLSNNKIGDHGALSLLSPLVNFHNLSTLTLYLNGNSFGDQGAYSLFYRLSNFIINLRIIMDLSNNVLTKQIEHLFKHYLKTIEFYQDLLFENEEIESDD